MVDRIKDALATAAIDALCVVVATLPVWGLAYQLWGK